MKNRNKSIIGVLAGIVVMMMFCSSVWATPASFFSGWTQFANDDEDGADGGQPYDHEHMFWKKSGNNLSIGVQSGFNLSTGKTGSYYLGDLALSFDNNTAGSGGSGYEYAYDFGLETKDYHLNNRGRRRDETVDANTYGFHNDDNGIDTAGLYDVSLWNNHVRQTLHNGDSTAPYAMDGGSIVANALSTDNGNETVDGETSYYRVAEFDVSSLLNPDGSLAVDAHITMSCGNDVMNGSFEIPGPGGPQPAAGVPEPSTVALLGIGLVGLAGGAARRRMKKKKEEAK